MLRRVDDGRAGGGHGVNSWPSPARITVSHLTGTGVGTDISVPQTKIARSYDGS